MKLYQKLYRFPIVQRYPRCTGFFIIVVIPCVAVYGTELVTHVVGH